MIRSKFMFCVPQLTFNMNEKNYFHSSQIRTVLPIIYRDGCNMDNGSDFMDNITRWLVFLCHRLNERHTRCRYILLVCNETESERADHKKVNFFSFDFILKTQRVQTFSKKERKSETESRKFDDLYSTSRRIWFYDCNETYKHLLTLNVRTITNNKFC